MAIKASIAVWILGVQAPGAGVASAQTAPSGQAQLAQAETPRSPGLEEKAGGLPKLFDPAANAPKAKSTLLLEQKLEGLPGFIVQVVLVEGPPGWVGGRHYHPGHLFGYILEGNYLFNFDDLTSKTVKAGEVFYETPNTVMRSRNGSSTEWVKDVVFHILREGQPAAVSVK